MGVGTMAKFAAPMLKDLEARLSRMEAHSPEIARKAVYSGAKILADEIKANLIEVLRDSEGSGDLLASFGITPISTDEHGDVNAKLGFDGYDHKGVPNQLKARALESGTSHQKKKPFARPAVKAKKAAAVRAMEETVNEEIKKLNK